MKIALVYCEDHNIDRLPEQFKTKVCLFKTNRGLRFESCVLIVNPLDTAERPYWVIKGDPTGKQVYPYAWLKLELEGDEERLLRKLQEYGKEEFEYKYLELPEFLKRGTE